jgi:hypothetical protein
MTEAAIAIRDADYLPPVQARPQAMTPSDMLSLAVERGASIDVMTKLMDLRERWEAGQARKAFDAAVADAKAEIPTIAKNREGHNKTRYADFAAYAAVVDPIIAKHGLSYRFRTTQTDRISVSCILSHRDGHSEENTLSGPADKTGSKNEIQAIGSTLTYLQRYTLVQALGLAASNDDDGKQAGSTLPIDGDQIGELLELIESVGANKAAFLKFFKVDALPDLPAARFQEAVSMLNAKRGRS